ncbi:MAG: PEP-CTERM sorting domain-containing protein [Cyanobacteria bacterium P01_A01_bin.80]
MTFTQDNELNPDPTAPIVGDAFITGSFQVPHQIPEPSHTFGLAFEVVGSGLFLRRKKNKITLKR